MKNVFSILALSFSMIGAMSFSGNAQTDRQSVKQPEASVLGKPNEANSAWLTNVTKEIQQKEYHITYQQEARAFSCPNRKQNFRAFFYPEKFQLQPRVTEVVSKLPDILPEPRTIRMNSETNQIDQWKVELAVDGIYRGTEKVFSPGTMNTTTVKERQIDYVHNGFTVQYINNEKGIRQNFLVNKKPQGTGNLSVKINVTGLKPILKNSDEVILVPEVSSNTDLERNAAFKVLYSDLLVTDATGKEIQAQMLVEDQSICLVINDIQAIYPLLIDPLSASPDWQYESNDQDAGVVVGKAGDVNGDGYSDVIVGHGDDGGGYTNRGVALIFHGSSTGLSTTPATTIYGDQTNAYFGKGRCAGDVNNDGYSDIMLTSAYYDNGQADEGAVFIYHGSSSGIATTYNRLLEKNQAGALFGIDLNTAGDINDDGYSDIIVSSYLWTNGQSQEGAAFVYLGSSSGIPTSSSFTLETNQAAAIMASVGSAGDVNGDGYSDIVMASPYYDNGQSNEGIVYLYMGSSTGVSTTSRVLEANQASAYFGSHTGWPGDMNGDGYSDVVVGAYLYDNGLTDEGAVFVYMGSSSGLSTTWSVILDNNQASSYFGIFAGGAGDVNGDCYSDVLITADDWNGTYTDEGKAYVYLGSSTGLSTTAAWTASGGQTTAHYGRYANPAGDVNGDGYSDIIVGAPHYDNGQTNEGRAYVYHGEGPGKWTQKTDFGGTAIQGGVGFSINTKGYIGTGSTGSASDDFWEYDPSNNSWTQKADFGGGARVSASGFAIDSKGYIGTGLNGSGTKQKDFWEYDPSNNTWTQKTDFGGTARMWAVGFSIGTKGYIGTGLDNVAGYKKDFWEYNPSNNTWTQKTDFGGSARKEAVGFSISSKGYIGTGYDGAEKKDFWEYNPSGDTWTQKADFGGTAMHTATGFSIGSRGYLGMGGDASYYYDDFWEYEPALNVWTQKADFEGADVNYPVGFSIGTVGYLGTGTTVGGATDDFWEYNPVPCSGGLRLINPTLTLENKTHEYQSAKIYPNPASNEAILSFPIGENQKGSLELYSTMGQKIIMYELKPLETLRIDLSGIQTGVYFYTIRVNGEIINSDKLIVIK